jgi:transcriptional regulator
MRDVIEARMRPIDFLEVGAYRLIDFLKEQTLESRPDLMRGTLDLLILRSLLAVPLHGLGIARRISQITEGSFDVKPGSLFPALYRLEERGLISAEWGESDTRRRAKFYRLTRPGRKQLQIEEAKWRRVVLAMGRALESTS